MRDAAVREAPLRVLVVDDSTLMRRAVAGMVAGSGVAEVVGEAADGLEALAAAGRLQPDVILLDIEMPRLDGLGFLREARLCTAARVIVISSVVQPGSATCREALALGAQDLLAKPSGAVSPDLAEQRRAALLDVLRRCRAA